MHFVLSDCCNNGLCCSAGLVGLRIAVDNLTSYGEGLKFSSRLPAFFDRLNQAKQLDTLFTRNQDAYGLGDLLLVVVGGALQKNEF